jgi:branched-chain amino acid transport system permease protein
VDIFIQQIINGLVLGSIYALVALGYTMVYGILGLINFAHGEVVMIGALTALTAIGLLVPAGLPGPVVVLCGLLIAIPVCMAVGFTIERIAYRPLRNAPRLAPLITAIGVSIVLQQLAMIGWGRNYHTFPGILPATPHAFMGASITDCRSLIIATAGDADGRAGVAHHAHPAWPGHAGDLGEPGRGRADGRRRGPSSSPSPSCSGLRWPPLPA